MTPTYEDLAIALGRLREALEALNKRDLTQNPYYQGSELHKMVDAALALPASGLWDEVKWLLENACIDRQEIPQELWDEWHRRRDALLGKGGEA